MSGIERIVKQNIKQTEKHIICSQKITEHQKIRETKIKGFLKKFLAYALAASCAYASHKGLNTIRTSDKNYSVKKEQTKKTLEPFKKRMY